MDVEQARPVSAADSDSYGTAQFLRHCLNLLNHAGAASDTASQLVAEVQSWGISLDKSVATSRDELKAADQTIAELVRQVKGRVANSPAPSAGVTPRSQFFSVQKIPIPALRGSVSWGSSHPE